MNVGGLLALTVLALGTAPDAQTEPPDAPLGASSTAVAPQGAVLRVGDVTVTATPAVESIDHAFFLPLTLTAVYDGDGTPPKRIAVRLCTPGQCAMYERVELAVGTKDRPAPVVHHRMVLPDDDLLLAPENDDAWGETAFDQVGIGSAGRRTVALLGSFGAPVPSGGWRLPPEQGGMLGSVQVVPAGDAVARDPDLVFAFAGVVLAPSVELNPVQRTEIHRFLRAGGVVMAPLPLADTLLPRIDPAAEPEAVLDGERALRPEWTRVKRVEAPPLATFEGQALRPYAALLELPVHKASVESGTLLAYDEGTAPVQILDALIAHDPAWVSGAFGGPLRAYDRAAELAQAAAIPLIDEARRGLFVLGLAAWAAICFVLLRRWAKRGALVAVGRLAVLSAALTGGVWGAARLSRTESATFKITVVQVAERAGFGLEHGVALVRLPARGEVEVTTPPGTHARPVVTGDDRYTPRAFARPTPTTLIMPSGPDAPVGASWSRPVPVMGRVSIDGSEADLRVANHTTEPFDLVLVVGPGFERWSQGPLAPGETLARTETAFEAGGPVNEPPDRVSAAAVRVARSLVSSCRIDPRLGAEQRCAIGVRKTPEGLFALVTQERP